MKLKTNHSMKNDGQNSISLSVNLNNPSDEEINHDIIIPLKLKGGKAYQFKLSAMLRESPDGENEFEEKEIDFIKNNLPEIQSHLANKYDEPQNEFETWNMNFEIFCVLVNFVDFHSDDIFSGQVPSADSTLKMNTNL